MIINADMLEHIMEITLGNMSVVVVGASGKLQAINHVNFDQIKDEMPILLNPISGVIKAMVIIW